MVPAGGGEVAFAVAGASWPARLTTALPCQAFVHELFGDALALIEPTQPPPQRWGAAGPAASRSAAVDQPVQPGLAGGSGGGGSGGGVGEGEEEEEEDGRAGHGLLSLMYAQTNAAVSGGGSSGGGGRQLGVKVPETPRPVRCLVSLLCGACRFRRPRSGGSVCDRVSASSKRGQWLIMQWPGAAARGFLCGRGPADAALDRRGQDQRRRFWSAAGPADRCALAIASST